MLAVLGEGRAAVEDIARRLELTLANDNGPTQVVLSGPSGALDSAVAELKAHGLRTRRLSVGGAFHSPAMEPAVPAFRELLRRMEIRNARVPVLSCVTAQPFDDVRRRLAEALTHPVRWLDVMRFLATGGVRRCIEVGPGRVLSGLVRRSLDGVEALPRTAMEPAGA
jgi:acyl transferase domain-containing protein